MLVGFTESVSGIQNTSVSVVEASPGSDREKENYPGNETCSLTACLRMLQL